MRQLFSFLSGKQSAKPPVVSIADIERGYQKHPSLAEYLPWRDVDEQNKVFLLEDNKSLAVGFEITPLPCEARPAVMMEKIAQAFKESLQNAIPHEKNHPWILQVFVMRNGTLSPLLQKIQASIDLERLSEPLVQAHLETMRIHLDYVSRPGGIFVDSAVTQQVFRGGFWQVYAFLYRRETDKNKKRLSSAVREKNQVLHQQRWEDIKKISSKLSDQWRACGLGVKRLPPADFYRWMVRWFNPSSEEKTITWPPENKRPIGWDLTEQLFFSAPESFDKGWCFNGLPHQVITIQGLSADPVIGHLSAERRRETDDKVFHLLDHLPEGSIFSMAIVNQAQSEVELHLKTVEASAVGRHALAVKVKSQVELAEHAIANNDPILPLVMAVYIRAEDRSKLREKEAQVATLLNNNGIKVITDDELYPIDAYLRYLPMAYDFEQDKKYYYRSQYVALSDIAKLLPFYGRSRGTPNPGMVMFNRGGEPWCYDLFKDKTKNSHFLLLGETGTGKSNTLNFLAMHALALYKPRLFIIEAGGSFDLLADYCASLELSVNKVKIDENHPVSLNPFAAGLKVLDQLEALESTQQTQWLNKEADRLSQEENQELSEEAENDSGHRDILGEMVLAALVMITGGEPKEEARIRRSDRLLIMEAIILAAKNCREAGKSQMIASDIMRAFECLREQCDPTRDAEKISRLNEMASGMGYFITDLTSRRFFNTPGEPWPLMDVTVMDFGLFAQEGYEDKRSIAFAGVVSKILALAEANQYSNRPIVVIFDENHLFSKLPLLAAIQTRIAKMGRKLGLWIWVATQNLKDFADESRKMLSLIETWMCLALPPDEIDQIERFKTLTEEQRTLFLSARKERGKYTEGVLLSPRLQGLFRNVPPRLYLAMAATEQSEKYQRRLLMKKLQRTELDAIKYIAHKMMEAPTEVFNDE